MRGDSKAAGRDGACSGSARVRFFVVDHAAGERKAGADKEGTDDRWARILESRWLAVAEMAGAAAVAGAGAGREQPWD